uniref:Chondroitin sulfate proteoglycan 4 n=2 Tax=Latimeria chalumnae TaxID=7897 RepID=H3B570_LATCH
ASFFGDSYVEVITVKASSVELHLQFQTSKGSGLLFLAAGQTDYLLVELQSGGLQVKLKLGAGEVIVESQAGLKLNNLVLHDVQLTLEGGTLTLTIDDLFNSSASVPSDQQELSSHDGIFVGGTGELVKPYLAGVTSNFRGCITTVLFNGIDLLLPLTSQPGIKTVHEVKEGCHNEFVAAEDDPIHFFGQKSFISFPGWNTREEGFVEFIFKSSVRQALLLYHFGYQTDFIYLGIVDGHLRGAVNNGSGIVTLDSNVYISDNQWHHVRMHINANEFAIAVNYTTSKINVNNNENKYMDLIGYLHIGGLDDKTLAKLKKSKIAPLLDNSIKSNSFIGCIKGLRINFEKKSLQDALVTKEIGTVCEEEDYDEDVGYKNFEVLTTSIPPVWQKQTSVPITVPCQFSPNLPNVFKNFTKLLDLDLLYVTEGKTAILQWKHIHPTIDLNSIGVRYSQVLFRVIHDARYGQLKLDIPGARSRGTFTLLDIINQKVRYSHDGSEDSIDQLVFEVIVYSKAELPDCLKKGQLYTLPVQITSVNDPPTFVFPKGDMILILEHTKKCIGPDNILVVDVDTVCNKLKIFVTGGPDIEEGYLENAVQPGQNIEEFSCSDLEAGNICYVHKSGYASQFMLQASDGQLQSEVVTLRMVALDPDLQVGNNTGLIVSQGEAAVITRGDLSVETNAVKQNLDILYIITEPLQFGKVQKQQIPGHWKDVMSFLQYDIEQGNLRYFSTDSQYHSEDLMEKLQFELRVGEKILPNNTFFIKIKTAKIKMINMVPLELTNKRQKNITLNDLEAVLEGQTAAHDSFQYKILRAPSKGSLQLLDHTLLEGSKFLQEDLRNGLLSYTATVRSPEKTEDSFLFQVFVGNQHSPVYTYIIRIGANPDVPILTNMGLSVLEGGDLIITKNDLFVESLNSMDFLYEVIQGPQHGKLMRLQSWQSTSAEDITVFTNDDILQKMLIYKHDDSETIEDRIIFTAVKQSESSADFTNEDIESDMVKGVLKIAVQPKNDEVPVRVVDKVFNIVRYGQRLLTTDDILFTDADSDFSDSQLVFVRRGIPYGSIVSVEDVQHQLFRFTQEDLRNKKVLFIHKGADRGHFLLQVSEGLHQSSALLEVQASEPYIKMANTSGLLVHQGGQEPLDTSILSAETNMDIRSESDITYQVTAPPKQGEILIRDQTVSSFSQEDLMNGRVVYRHDNSRNSRDQVTFLIEANQVSVEETFQIRVALESYEQPPTLVKHEKIFVFENEAAEIQQDQLMVSHEDSTPSEIVYSVTHQPRYGFLVMVSDSSSSASSSGLDSVQTFTQQDIQDGRVLYMHSKADQQVDQFTVDVTNGFKMLEGIQVFIEILPGVIPLETQNITLEEGSSETLNEDVLTFSNRYFTDLNLEFIILEQPKHGAIRHSGKPENLFFFSWAEVEQGLITYMHDGSETQTDGFTIIANATEIDRHSEPMRISVTVTPINDETPVVVVNAGLQLWVNSTAEITSHLLSTEDQDTPPDQVVYSIQPPSNGKVALKSSPTYSILQFSQTQINQGHVIFTHEGSLFGGFMFEVSDGSSASSLHFFNVTAKQLVITMETKQDLTVYPGTFHPITSQNLKAVTSGSGAGDPPQIIFTVTRAPSMGRLVTTDLENNTQEVYNFTQHEVEAGTIFYQHDQPSEPFWISQDSFEFIVSSLPAVTEKQMFQILVSFEADVPQHQTRLWNNKGILVMEGENAIIGTSNLDASNLLASLPESDRPLYDVVFWVENLPTHGHLSISEDPPYFLQADLNYGKLEYSHDGSETFEDSFKFRAWLHPRAQAHTVPPLEDSIVISEAFNITIKGLNDNPPQLISQGLSLKVPQGSSVLLTQDDLNVVDLDNSPQEIKYNIITGPNNGFLVNKENSTIQIKQFTQADVNAAGIMFTSNGNSSLGSFYFSVTDGKHPPLFILFSIEILPLVVTLDNNKEVEVIQGDNGSFITRDHLRAKTNGEDKEVTYKITVPVRFGKLMVGKEAAMNFTQKHVDDGQVWFKFTEFTSPVDSFQFLAQTSEAETSGNVNITVKPLIKMAHNLSWPRGTTVLITTDIMDASELGKRTDGMPTFNITQQPLKGQFVKVLGDNKDQTSPVDLFTQKDLEDGIIGLELFEEKEAAPHFQEDSFQFQLLATEVPPAMVALAFKNVPYIPNVYYNATLLKVPFPLATLMPEASGQSETPEVDINTSASPFFPRKPGSSRSDFTGYEVFPTSTQPKTETTLPAQEGTHLAFQESSLFYIIIPICIILLLLIIAALLALYFVRRNKTGKHNVQATSSKPKNGVAEKETFRKTEHAQTVPMVTVTPLESKGEDSLNKDEGQVDPELLQFCRTSNPTLKTNQYWV